MSGIKIFFVKSLIGLVIVGSISGGLYVFREDIFATKIGQNIERMYNLKYVYYYRTSSEIKYYLGIGKEAMDNYKDDLKTLPKDISPSNIQGSQNLNLNDSPVNGNTEKKEEYMERARDATRLTHIFALSTATTAYYIDHEKLPEPTSDGCISSEIITDAYFDEGKVPIDPIEGRKSMGCTGTSKMTYIYKTGVNEKGTPYYVLGVEMENKESGNSDSPIENINNNTVLEKGKGKMYYIIK